MRRGHAALARSDLRAGTFKSAGAEPSGGGAASTAAQWEEAFVRVESYLRAYQLESRMQLGRLTEEIIAAARALAHEMPGEDPITLSIHVAQARIGQWTVGVMGEGDWTDPRFRARGRLALLIAEVPRKCPQAFLSSGEPLPQEMRERLAASQLQPGPEMRLAGMPSAPLEFAQGGEVIEKWTTFSRKSFARAAASWIVFVGLAGLTWLITHWRGGGL